MLRRVLLATLIAISVPAVASAQPAPGDGLLATPPADEPAPSTMPWAQDPAPGHAMRAPEYRPGRPSGFWTSTRPARGGAYRWRILGVGVGVLAITAFFVVRLLRRTTNVARSARAAR